MGAMENAGCVTVNEIYLFRSKVTESMVERRALTVLHELAHMWFGNLVTMRWWNDLWLNESFAEWASTTCQAEATRWTEAWTTFGTHEKDWAYRQDQLPSTHPIVADIHDLEDVEVNFDGITYAKGASVLKQLVAYVGREPFLDGLRAYFRKHAWGNTSARRPPRRARGDLGSRPAAWSTLWLETAGVNTLRPDVEVDAGGASPRPRRADRRRRAYPTLRPHRIAIGLYAVPRAALPAPTGTSSTSTATRTEVPELVGLAAARPAAAQRRRPQLRQDPLRRALVRHALAHPRGFAASLPRSLVLGAAWDMIRDAEMGARHFVEWCSRRCPASRTRPCAHPHRPAETAVLAYTAPEHREATRSRRATACGRSREPPSPARRPAPARQRVPAR